VAAGIVLALIVLTLTLGVDLFTDYLWFAAVGHPTLFTTVLWTQITLFAIGAIAFAIPFYASTITARRLARGLEYVTPTSEDSVWAFIARMGARMGDFSAYRLLVNAGIAILGAVLAAIMGSILAGQWAPVMRYVYQVPFGVVDQVFNRDVGFYTFGIPFFRLLHSWLFGVVLLTACGTVAVYAVVASYELGINLERVIARLPLSIRIHVGLLAACLMFLAAGNHLLDVYDTVYSTRGAVYGASYTDVTVQVPALYVLSTVAVVSGFLLLAAAITRRVRLAIAGLGAWAALAFVGGLLVPSLVERFDVKPNQLERERPYIENSIASTRRAYGLDDIQQVEFKADETVATEDFRAAKDTVRNIRLWDHRPLLRTLQQVQSIRTYYSFIDVDVDRYKFGDDYRQVMLAARELVPSLLPSQAQTWVNTRLKFTHGYGVAMAHVSSIAEEGRPQLIVQDVPPRGELPIQRPELYFGSRTTASGPTDYVVVRTTEPEFDYPRGEGNAETRHEGQRGVAVGTLLNRLAFAVKFRDANLLLSSAITPESQLLYRRSIAERVAKLAPFLVQDKDPYLVVAGGRLFWMLDAYTISSFYPHSEPRRLAPGVRVNYMRNSVKVVVDAYDGGVTFYLADPADPVVGTYQRIFPAPFVPLSEMPADLRRHIRYPEDLFLLQADILKTYHMQDATAFYNREDAWSNALEKIEARESPEAVAPYYVIMALPGQQHEEFLLMQPFTPVGKHNMIAWLAARCDEPNYGKLVLYKYPKDKLIYGPFQFEGRIDQDPAISSQFTLWSSAGSKVLRGNTLVIPLGSSNLYVEPIYLQSDVRNESNAIPELKRVVVGTGSRIAMEPTLEEALAKLFGQASPTVAAGQPANVQATAPAADIPGLIRSASDRFTRSQEALKAGDWARYGEEQRGLEADLRRLAELAR
jgi:hypothetical protein